MSKQFHFISGLPRSGSTLLSAILNQNPAFSANISNPLARFIRSIILDSFAGPGYKLQCPEQKRIQLIRSLVETYHDEDVDVCFNTNRGWTALNDVLNITHPDSRVICCVRDINWILDSYEILFRKNPFSLSSLYSEQGAESVYSRCDSLMQPGNNVRFAYDALKEAITGPNRNRLFLIEYDQLSKHPEQVLRALYAFIKQPYFEHDFDDVQVTFDDYDNEANIQGLHTIRKKVEYVERSMILPPDIQNKYQNLEVWR